MLRKRSKGLSISQGLMSDHSSPTLNCNTPRASSPFMSPRPFVAFSSPSHSEAAILESKTLTASPDRNSRKPLLESSAAETSQQHPWSNGGGDSRAIGLGILDALTNEPVNEKSLKHESRMVLFGSQLRIQIPGSVCPAGATESPRSPIEFGVKTKSSQLALLSPIRRSSFVNPGSEAAGSPPPRVVTGRLSKTEMELSRSEDYTCVITHGPNPRTTHIFDTCSDCGDGFAAPREEDRLIGGRCLDDILSFCNACKKSLQLGEDILVCRDEKAFCGVECQCQKIFLDQMLAQEPPPSPRKELITPCITELSPGDW